MRVTPSWTLAYDKCGDFCGFRPALRTEYREVLWEGFEIVQTMTSAGRLAEAVRVRATW